MSDPSRSVYSSDPFKFVVDGKPFYIHADLVSHHSKPLDRMINGGMAEAQQRYATLQDVDGGTFNRFIEWAYKGFYTAADCSTVIEEDSDIAGSSVKHEDVEESVDQVEPVPQEDNQVFNSDPPADPPFGSFGSFGEMVEEDSWAGYGRRSSKKVKGRKKDFSPEYSSRGTTREDLRYSFKHRRPVERKTSIEPPPVRQNQSSAEVYRDVFLSHACLYVFAEKNDIQPLRMLALDQLHATLAVFTLYTQRTGDVIDLLRYVYDNTGEQKEGVEDLRTVMMGYVVCEMDTLIHDQGFKDVMIKDGGALLSDFMTMVGKRIS